MINAQEMMRIIRISIVENMIDFLAVGVIRSEMRFEHINLDGTEIPGRLMCRPQAWRQAKTQANQW